MICQCVFTAFRKFSNVHKNGVIFLLTLSERIKKFQTQKGYKSVSAFANACGIPASTLYDVIKGRSKSLSSENAQKLAKFVGVSVDEILGIETEKTPDAEAPRAEVAEAYKLFNDLSAEKQQEALNYLRFLSNNQ